MIGNVILVQCVQINIQREGSFLFCILAAGTIRIFLVFYVSLEQDDITKAVRNIDLKFQKGTLNFETKEICGGSQGPISAGQMEIST